MATHVGIELSPVACRIVELSATNYAKVPETRVRSFAIVPPRGVEMSRRLASLRRRSVAVVVWGAKSDHRQVMVQQNGYEKMKAEALLAARQAGVDSDGMLTDIAPVGASPRGTTRRAVMLAMAESREVAAAVRPLREAGLRIRSVVTPGTALTSLFRMRRAFSEPDAIEAYVALEETATTMALVRNGALSASREMTWGFGGERHAARELRPRDEIATRLADALTEFFSSVGAAADSVRQISICGGMPELRSMTIPLMERLDLEVETLDSLFGIDTAHLPEPADEFRDRNAALRLAWAVAADWRAPVNLLRQRRRQEARTAMARVAVMAGVAAGLGFGWRIQRSQWWQSTANPVASMPASAILRATPRPEPKSPMAPPPAPPSFPKQATLPKLPDVARAPSTVAGTPPPPPPPASRVTEPPPGARMPTLRVPAPVPPASVPAPRATEVPPLANAVTPPTTERERPTESARSQPSVPPVAPSVPRASEPAPHPVAPVTPRVVPPAPRVAPAAPPPATPVPRVGTPPPRVVLPPPSPALPSLAPPPQRQAAPTPPPLPFDAVLGTILYSPDRKLAIIDGRIVGPGDDVRGARVVDITQNSVLLRDAKGQMRILALGYPAR